MNLARIRRKIKSCIDIFSGSSRGSYSQFGEDLIVDSILTSVLQINKPTYLDIGANKPKLGNNTYFFYLKCNFGVCIEPDFLLYQNLCKQRPHDIIINAGVGLEKGKSTSIFYYFPEPYTGWNTFSKNEALAKQSETNIDFKCDKIIPLINVNDVINDHFKHCPDFLSIDVEGLDYQILKSLDFSKFSPSVICVETMDYHPKLLGSKNLEIIQFLKSKNYILYADTYVNSIFVLNKD